MKQFILVALLGMFGCGSAYAADAPAATAAPAAKMSQQDKMKMCNDKAADMKGDDRKAFMKTCLSAKPPEKPKSKMAMCNEKTKGMVKADADKTRSECMKAA
jgi:psiF repeat